MKHSAARIGSVAAGPSATASVNALRFAGSATEAIDRATGRICEIDCEPSSSALLTAPQCGPASLKANGQGATGAWHNRPTADCIATRPIINAATGWRSRFTDAGAV